MRTYLFTAIIFLSTIVNYGFSQHHPCLSLTPSGVSEIKKSIGKYPDFDRSIAELRTIADKAVAGSIVVPVPKDAGGGYTHEKHKSNYYDMYSAGIMYQLSSDKRYAQFVKNMLMEYAKIYRNLPLHPVEKSEAKGKIFWQTLNDAVWLVHTANAYDCIYNYLTQTERKEIESKLFYPMVEFISNGNEKNYETFNKMHNHGTWAMAAVGLAGYAIGDKNLVNKALYGSNKDGKSGFIKQLDTLFSPDGYFTEGPYYQRYAIWPFLIFSQAIQHNQPDLALFKYRNGILNKATNTLLECTYQDEIFHLNDALDKTIETQELISAVDITYQNNQTNKALLDIAKRQKKYLVSDAGIVTAKAVAANEAKPFVYHSLLLRDGAKGDEGGIAIFRADASKTTTLLTLKATSHGLSHGHYDKLSITLFDNGNDILADYGAVRFLNIEPKSGGGYTTENYTWGMQTIAHNTVTIDETSHFNANIKTSSQNHSDINFCSYLNKNCQVVSATENHAYRGVALQRITALVNDNSFEHPIALDLFRVVSDSTHQVDFPFYFKGQMIASNFKFTKNLTELHPLGTKNGYQHLWKEATAKTDLLNSQFTWLNGNRFYTITSVTNQQSELFFNRVGANDKEFNLRPETAFMIRQKAVKNHTFVSAIEPHGVYDLSREITSGVESNIASIALLVDNESYSAIVVKMTSGKSFLFIAVNSDFNETKTRNISIENQNLEFKGNYYFGTHLQK